MNEIKYIVPGNKNYYISKENKVSGFKGVEDLEIIEGMVTIPLYGLVYVLDLDWLLLYCKYNIKLPKGYTNNIKNIEFKPYSLESHGVRYKHIVLFKKPVLYIDNPSYRLLAMYPGTAINMSGDIVNVETGRYRYTVKTKSYKTIYLYDSVRGKHKSILLHRLVAMAWADNDDYINKPIVDHKDGIKNNCHASNLEWVSFVENNRRTAKQGLREDNLDVKVKDYKDNKVVIFSSMTQACEFMGRSRINRLEEFCEVPKLINDRYQIKLCTDKTDWDFNGKKTIKVDFGDKVKEYHKLKELMKDLFPDIKSRQNRSYVVSMLKSKYPNAVVKFPEPVCKLVKKTYQLLERDNGNIHESNSLAGFCSKVSHSKSTITKAFALGEETQVSGISVREKSDKVWKEVKKYVSKISNSVRLECLKDGTRSDFDSMRKVAAFLGVDRKTVNKVIKAQVPLKGYLISKKINNFTKRLLS